ncbi:MAG: AMIN domain-containing protein, partial [Desulfatiglandaceae bacterium]
MTKWFKWKSARVWILLFLCAAVGFGPDSAGAGQKAATRLDFIRTTSKENHLVIHFEADGAIKDYKASTKEDPPRIVFDLYGIETKREGLQKVTVEDVHARGIRYQGFIDKVRVVVDTETQYLEQYKVTEVDGGLQVRIGDASVTQAEKAPASAATPMEEPRAAEPVDQGQTPVTHFESIQTESKETYLDVHLKADGPIKKYKVFSYDDPATIVIDLFGVRDRLKGPHKLPLEDRHARRVRYGVHPDKVRVVLDTETQYLKQYQVMAVDGGLQVRIGDASGTQSQEAPAPAASPAAVKRAAVAAKDGQTPTTASERIPTRSQKPAAPTFTTEANTMDNKTDSREQPVVAPKLRAAPASSSRTPPTDAGALQEPDTDALIELLMQKGVISEQEADKLKKKAPIPRPSTLGEEPVIYIVPDVPDAQKQKIVKEIADQSREDIQRIEQKTTTRSEDILQRQRVTERDVEELERKISDIDKKTFKSEWAQRIRFGGDIRLRYERIGY